MDDEDYSTYLEVLDSSAKSNAVEIYAYALLPNEIQLLAAGISENCISRMMQAIGRVYVRKFNKKYAKTGSPWEGRFRSSTIEVDTGFLDCMRYVESAPLRAHVATSLEQYLWSSYRLHAGIATRGAVSGHPQYWSLGNTPFEREAMYRALAADQLTEQRHNEIAAAILKGRPLGSETFLQNLSTLTAHNLMPAKRGRPVKSPQAFKV